MKQIIEKISIKTKGENIFEFTSLVINLITKKNLKNKMKVDFTKFWIILGALL